MIYFLRHGLDDEKYIGGWSDVSLVDEGIEQIKNTILKMDDMGLIPKKIVSSDIKRAIETSKLVSEHFKIQYEVDELFREQSKGKLNGLLKENAKLKYPDFIENVTIDTKYPNGESLKDLYNKINNSLDEILNLEDDTLIVTHRGVINMIYYLFNGIPLDMEKERFNVSHASVHEVDKNKKIIRRVI